jgi:hypothetical protein
MSGGQFR